MANIMSVDVEDWFHLLELSSTPAIGDWDNMESRVERNFYHLLDEFDRTDTKATCFFLGWVADRFPKMVIEACQRGHEIASHGYSHQLVYTQSRRQFAEDIQRSKAGLEQISGKRVVGYRAPGFSIVARTTWAFDELIAAGYEYDSSVFPATRGHGGIRNAQLSPHSIESDSGNITEFPLSAAVLLGSRVCCFGGGYLRLSPLSLIRHMSRRVNAAGRPVIYYLHPREIDPGHPRLPMGWRRRFKSYVNLRSTMPKLRAILAEQHLTSFRGWIAESNTLQ